MWEQGRVEILGRLNRSSSILEKQNHNYDVSYDALTIFFGITLCLLSLSFFFILNVWCCCSWLLLYCFNIFSCLSNLSAGCLLWWSSRPEHEQQISLSLNPPCTINLLQHLGTLKNRRNVKKFRNEGALGEFVLIVIEIAQLWDLVIHMQIT